MRFAKLVMPDKDIDESPFIQLCVNEDWGEILMSVMSRLAMDSAWVDPDDGYRGEQNTLIFNNLVVAQIAQGASEVCGCCEQTVLHRATSTGGLEISTDGGETWRPDPNDPRVTGTQLSNTIVGEGNDKKCNAANNAIGNFKDAQAAFGHSLSTTTTIVGLALAIAAEIALLLFSVGTAAEILIPLIISTATALFGILEADYNALFTEAVWEQLTCDIFCTVGDDGQFTAAQLNDLLAMTDSDFDGNVALTFHSIITGWGTVGLNNACIAGSSSASDCSGCDCACHGETVGSTIDVYAATVVERTGCNLVLESIVDGDHHAIGIQWDGTHGFKLTDEAVVSGAPNPPDTWQWRLIPDTGPIFGLGAPIGVTVQQLVFYDSSGGSGFTVSWDVASA